eukprot:CAMPEP_0170413334 /NCGR_PEP_ID=MMETSP0117_2-20130122/31468_1 /TAXON_ID=400756 /ORGANISM="Durinskia baltica, Strain CSIRO CS-38" /LENGTH=79 /DNA_ID=CAMNT_0010671127 /DNA_START=142 /DNA_END=381 /DNA_ORIENTATION=+
MGDKVAAYEDIERHVVRKFEICQRLGKGAYGIVWKAIEKRSRAVIALKKCFDAFRNADALLECTSATGPYLALHDTTYY